MIVIKQMSNVFPVSTLCKCCTMCFYVFNSGHFSELMVECDRCWRHCSRKVTSYCRMGPSLQSGHWGTSEEHQHQSRYRGNEEYRNTPGLVSTVQNAVSNLSGWDELLIEFRFLFKLFKCQKHCQWLLDCESILSKKQYEFQNYWQVGGSIVWNNSFC